MPVVEIQEITARGICSLANELEPTNEIIAITSNEIHTGTVIRKITHDDKTLFETEQDVLALSFDPEGGFVDVTINDDSVISLTKVQ